MNSTLSDWNAKFRQSFDHLNPSVISSLSTYTFTQDILVIIGFITVCLLLLILILKFILKVREIYQTSEPKERYKKSKYSSYQKLHDTDNNHCQCFPKFQCVKPICQISSSYEQINERHRNNSIYRVCIPRNLSCIRIHTVK